MDLLWPIILIAVPAIGLSALLARETAKKNVEPLNILDLEQPLKNDVYEETFPLLHRIHLGAVCYFTYILHRLCKHSMVFTNRKIYNAYCRNEHTIPKENSYDNLSF